MSFDSPLWLLLLPLALWPLWAEPGLARANAWAATLPRDRLSDGLDLALRAAAVVAVVALLIALAGPHRPEVAVERVGRGAEIVLVLDRSRSMDESFAGSRTPPPVKGTGPEALAYYSTLRAAEARESKGKVARRLLAEFTARRPDDRFGMIAFSTLPIRVLGFTQKPEAIQAAISAGDIGRGLSETNIAFALQAALDYFVDRPYTGSRILMLVSDGGDTLDVDARERIAELARRVRVAIYWLYIRSPRSPGLMAGSDEPPSNVDAVPEYFLHRYFGSLGVPYRAYEAESTDALQKAIADVDRLENLPITYFDTLPRRDLAPWAYGVALAAVLLLLAAQLAEIRS
ncbi:VWFA domain-containing protein [Rubrivivax sp. A210]|uniref:vWA domain-containing protein n=1 Tax=Rubrivivax sp. A210 TaxID=2772301 RepID=UPI00191AAEDA|nr:vWA domain-containing protein [Rubrivivax sp. A210]CAD5372133.1 VWFA domain-containing protein [Rubrivivax sp. A210]